MSEHEVHAEWKPPVDRNQPKNITVRLTQEHSGHRISVSVRDDGRSSAFCMTCAVTIPQPQPAPEPTEAPKTEVPTSADLAAFLRWCASDPVGRADPPPESDGLTYEELLQAAARRLENTVLVIGTPDPETNADLAHEIEDATGVPTFAVPPDTQVTEVVPHAGIAAYVLTMPNELPDEITVEMAARLHEDTEKPIFLGHGLDLKQISEDTMRRHGWVRAEVPTPKPNMVACDQCRKALVLRRDGAYPLHLSAEWGPDNLPVGPPPRPCPRSWAEPGRPGPFDKDSWPDGPEVVTSPPAPPEVWQSRDPEPLQPGVQWEHFLGGLTFAIDLKGDAVFMVDSGNGTATDYALSTGAAERIIDVLSRWLPTQQDWTAPKADEAKRRAEDLAARLGVVAIPHIPVERETIVRQAQTFSGTVREGLLIRPQCPTCGGYPVKQLDNQNGVVRLKCEHEHEWKSAPVTKELEWRRDAVSATIDWDAAKAAVEVDEAEDVATLWEHPAGLRLRWAGGRLHFDSENETIILTPEQEHALEQAIVARP